MMVKVVLELAARHGLEAATIVEAWEERAAIREYDAGTTRCGAELAALHDVEQQFSIGLHCPETRRMMAVGGDRHRPSAATGYVHARPA